MDDTRHALFACVMFLCFTRVSTYCGESYTSAKPCIKGEHQTWFTYNNSENMCINITYDGCSGTGNLFQNYQKCKQTCERKEGNNTRLYNFARCIKNLNSENNTCGNRKAVVYDQNKCKNKTINPCTWNKSSIFKMQEECTEFCGRDGQWTSWNRWNECSTNCNNDIYGFRVRSRSCKNPTPDFGGKPCEGYQLQYERCYHCSNKKYIENSMSLTLTTENDTYTIEYHRDYGKRENVISFYAWNISAPADQLLFIKMREINVNGSATYDFLEIKDGVDRLRSYSGYGNSSLISNSNQLQIYIQSYGKVIFNADIQLFQKDCGNIFENNTGVIEITSFEGKIPHNMKCTYTILSEMDSWITLTMKSFQLGFGDIFKIQNVRPNNQPEEVTFTHSSSQKEVTKVEIYGKEVRILLKTNFYYHTDLFSIEYKVSEPRDCLNVYGKTDYILAMNVSASGAPCLSWNSTNDVRDEVYIPNDLCRFYNGSKFPVCFTQTDKVEECNISMCDDGKAGIEVGETIDEHEIKDGENTMLDGNRKTKNSFHSNTATYVVVGAGIALFLAIPLIIIAARKKRQRKPTKPHAAWTENGNPHGVAIKIDFDAGTATFSRTADNVSQDTKYDYTEVEGAEQDDDYASVDNDSLLLKPRIRLNNSLDNISDSSYAVVDRQTDTCSIGRPGESPYVEVENDDYDVLRKSRENVQNIKDSNIYGDGSETYAVSTHAFLRSVTDDGDYGIGIPLNLDTTNESPVT